MKYAVRLYNKDEHGIVYVLEAENKNDAVKQVYKINRKNYIVGQAFQTDLPLGFHTLVEKTPVYLRDYSEEDQKRIRAEINEQKRVRQEQYRLAHADSELVVDTEV